MALFPQLPTHLELQIVGLLSRNEITCTVRALNKAYADRFRSYTVVRLSQPVPRSAFVQQWSASSPALRSLNLAKRQQLLYLTASSGVLENLELALKSAGCLLRDELGLMEAGAGAGHLHVCLWLRDMGLTWGTALDAAAYEGRRDVCEQLLALGCLTSICCYPSEAACAARRGHVSRMDWLLALPDGCLLDSSVVKAAAFGCDLATMQRLLTASWLPEVLPGGGAVGAAVEPQNLLDVANHCVEAAARSPTPDWRSKVEWLEGRFPDLPRRECSQVAALPDAVERFTWLRGRGHPLGERSVNQAAWAGNIAALTYLLDEAGVRVVSTAPTCTAGGQGHLAALQLLVARGCPVDASSTLSGAARAGHLAVVAWLVEELGVEISELGPEVMNAAAKLGSLELLFWLRERGCPWTDDTFADAAEGGCEAALEWLVERGCPLGDGADCYNAAASCGDLATVRFLRRLGIRWGPADAISSKAVGTAPLAMLRWLVETVGVPVDWEAALEATFRLDVQEDEAVRDWLREGKRRQEGAVPPHT